MQLDLWKIDNTNQIFTLNVITISRLQFLSSSYLILPLLSSDIVIRSILQEEFRNFNLTPMNRLVKGGFPTGIDSIDVSPPMFDQHPDHLRGPEGGGPVEGGVAGGLSVPGGVDAQATSK